MNRPVLLKPLISEKSMLLIKKNLYTFVVDNDARKGLIKKIVAEKFKVTPLSIKIVNVKGKHKPQRTKKGYFRMQSFKKAIVLVKTGQSIPVFEQASEEKNSGEVKVTTAEGEVIAETKVKKSLLKRTKIKIEKSGK